MDCTSSTIPTIPTTHFFRKATANDLFGTNLQNHSYDVNTKSNGPRIVSNHLQVEYGEKKRIKP